MFVTATLEAKTGNANVVPVGAIVNLEGQNMIFVPSGKNQYKAVRVAFELLGLLRNKQE